MHDQQLTVGLIIAACAVLGILLAGLGVRALYLPALQQELSRRGSGATYERYMRRAKRAWIGTVVLFVLIALAAALTGTLIHL